MQGFCSQPAEKIRLLSLLRLSCVFSLRNVSSSFTATRATRWKSYEDKHHGEMLHQPVS